jgi:translation initiation factor IF-3
VRLLQRFAEDVAEFGTVESTPTIDGRNMVMVIGPLKNKADAKAEAQAKKAAERPPRAAKAEPKPKTPEAKAPAPKKTPAKAATAPEKEEETNA